jgi:leucine dehydrogenase
MLKRTEHKERGYERVVRFQEPTTGLDAWIAIHSTKLGPALGGARFWSYDDPAQALGDSLRLAKGMTAKWALVDMGFGGGKAVINARGVKKTPHLLESFGEAVALLDGSYITAEDVGTNTEDMRWILRTAGPGRVTGLVDPSPATAYGVLVAFESACAVLGYAPHDATIAVQGVGKVGMDLVGRLRERYPGAGITVSDKFPEVAAACKERYGVTVVDPGTIYGVDARFFSPCALGGIVNAATVPLLQDKVVVGSANNQLDGDGVVPLLRRHRVTYFPDVLVNAGGVISVAHEQRGPYDLIAVERDIDMKIGVRSASIVREYVDTGRSMVEIVKDLVAESLAR